MQAGMTALNSHRDTPPEQSTSFSSEPNSPQESVFRALAVRRGRDWRNSAVGNWNKSWAGRECPGQGDCHQVLV